MVKRAENLSFGFKQSEVPLGTVEVPQLVSLNPCMCSPQCLPGGSDVKESACNAGDPGLIPGSGRSPGEGNGYPLQYFC